MSLMTTTTLPFLRRRTHGLAAILLILVVAVAGRPAAAFETAAREAFLIDLETGAVLLDKDADTLMPPASMSKLMTLYIAFEELASGRLSLEDALPVSEKAWRMGGSKMFVLVNSRVRVEDLLRGIIVQSGNDACIVLAEGLAGNEDDFARLMTERAHELGLEHSTFRNATGWPDPEHRMTVREIALLSRLIIENFPQYYHYFSEESFAYADITQHNRNPLLGRVSGVDGLKTGHTAETGYGVAVSAERDGRRLVLVVSGLKSEKERAEESARLIEWGFREFTNHDLFKAGDTVERARVWMGTAKDVALVIPSDLRVTLPRRARKDMKVVVRYNEPIPAPISEGDPVATLVMTAPDTEPVEVPLLAGEAVERKGLFGRLGALFSHFVFGD